MTQFARSPIAAILGPTNTGKTHVAVERMLGHSSGMIGFPLRLLAREIYDRVVSLRGAGAAALITGEERIWPETARYLLCTAEAMPGQLSGGSDGASPFGGIGADGPAFVAIDEAQLGRDRERGHVFTARLLAARGRAETMILGSGALRPVVRALVPGADIQSRLRFSTLSYAGPSKLAKLPPRSVIVAFSIEEVYALAEALRRVSGGAAVVMGALSPATRNAQVAMFQSGEVDYLVATDAIGMGLNLDVAHVAFASLSKFDGQRTRRLVPAEMAQIAGRAGRHQRDGSFGSVGSAASFTDAEVAAIEEHHFPDLDWLFWREADPSTESLPALMADLERVPDHPALRAAPEATDLAVLRQLAQDADVAAQASQPALVRRLWAACSVPDFVKAGPMAHARLVQKLWRGLATGHGHVDRAWFDGQLARLDDVTGTVESIADRMTRVRTLCYIAQRQDWLADPLGGAGAARLVESRLSDALHAALTARFVDRRTTVLLRALGDDARTLAVVIDPADGTVRVEGEAIGTLDGFAFRPDPAARAPDHRLMFAAAERALRGEYAARTAALAQDDDAAFALLSPAGAVPQLAWRGHAVAQLVRGRHRLAPRLSALPAVAALDPQLQGAILARLSRWLDGELARHMAPLLLADAQAQQGDTPAPSRALFAALVDGLGVAPRAPNADVLAQLTPEQRNAASRLGVRIGALDLFVPAMLKPAAQRWRAALLAIWFGEALVPPPPPGATLVADDAATLGRLAGDYRHIGARRLRVDLAEKMGRAAHDARAVARRSAAPPRAEEAPSEAAPAPPLPVGGLRMTSTLADSLAITADEWRHLMRQLGFLPLPSHDQPPNIFGWRWRGLPRHREPADAPPRRVAQPGDAKGKVARRQRKTPTKSAPQRAPQPARVPAPSKGSGHFAGLSALLAAGREGGTSGGTEGTD